jgi:ATP-dependent protease ClpP protease subunit
MRDIDVYGYIGDSWFDDDCVTAKQFVDQLRDAGDEDVTIHVNSCGGDVFHAQTMADAIRSHKGHVTASVEGIAASAASFFCLTADEVVMNPSALVMVHNPSSSVMGDASDMRKGADTLDKVRSTIVRSYVAKTGRSDVEVGRWMDEETWFDADEALESGLVDSLTDAMPVAACLSRHALDSFRNAPETLGASLAPDAPTSAETGAGEPEKTIFHDENASVSEPGADEEGTGAAPKAVCVTGTFLNA